MLRLDGNKIAEDAVRENPPGFPKFRALVSNFAQKHLILHLV